MMPPMIRRGFFMTTSERKACEGRALQNWCGHHTSIAGTHQQFSSRNIQPPGQKKKERDWRQRSFLMTLTFGFICRIGACAISE